MKKGKNTTQGANTKRLHSRSTNHRSRKRYKPEDKEAIIERLFYYFKLAYNRNKACEMVGLPRSTLESWENADINLALRINEMMNKPNELARSQLIESMKGKDKQTCQWWLERQEKQSFSTKQEIEQTVPLNVEINIKGCDTKE